MITKNPKKPIEYLCIDCDFITHNKKDYTRHLSTTKHLEKCKNDNRNHTKRTMYSCKECDFITNNKYNYDKHLMTPKHTESVRLSFLQGKNPKKCIKKPLTMHVCEICCKEYKYISGLSRHKTQGCSPKAISIDTESAPPQCHDGITPETVGIILKETMTASFKEMSKMMVTSNTEAIKTVANEMAKNAGTYTTNTNSHNKTFNMNFFLNETCKDAMNITDFVRSLKLTLRDLEKVGELGYAEGISQMFIKGLNDLDVTRRPIHCSDAKREILHIKDHDRWEKDESQVRLKNAIKDLTNKNIMLLDDWCKENPGCTEYNHRKNTTYLRMMCESMGPVDNNTEKRDVGKIVRTIAKNTIVNKSLLGCMS